MLYRRIQPQPKHPATPLSQDEYLAYMAAQMKFRAILQANRIEIGAQEIDEYKDVRKQEGQ